MEFDLNHHPRFYIQFNVWFNLLLKMFKIDLSFHLAEYLLLVTRLNQIIRTNHFFCKADFDEGNIFNSKIQNPHMTSDYFFSKLLHCCH